MVSLIGVKHTPGALPLLFEEIDRQIAKAKGKPIVVGVEAQKQNLQEKPFWASVVRQLLKDKRVQVAFLENPTGDRIANRTQREMERADNSFIFTGEFGHQPEERLDIKKGKFVLTVLRRKSFARRIKKHHVAIAVLGASHAFALGKKLRIKPAFVACTESEVKAVANRELQSIKTIVTMWRLKKLQRRAMFRRKGQKIRPR